MRVLVGFMYFSVLRAENLIHGRLRPVRLLSGGPCPPVNRIFPPGPARTWAGLRATGPPVTAGGLLTSTPDVLSDPSVYGSGAGFDRIHLWWGPDPDLRKCGSGPGIRMEH